MDRHDVRERGLVPCGLLEPIELASSKGSGIVIGWWKDGAPSKERKGMDGVFMAWTSRVELNEC